MKYMLFDLTVVACSIVIGMKFVRNRGTSRLEPVCSAPDIGNTSHISIAGKWRHQHQQNFDIGDIVEVFEPKIHPSYAFYAEIIREDPQDNGSSSYKIRTLLAKSPEIFHGVKLSSMRPHKLYEFGKRVMCTYGKSIDSSSRLAPCTILSHYGRGSDTMYYVLENLDDEITYRKIPMSRIRPIMKMTPSLRDEFERLPSSETDEDESEHLLIGVVELDEDKERNFASPLIITSYNEDGTYNLHHTFHDSRFNGVDPEIVNDYHVYEDGAEALCKVNKLHRVSAIPCTVVSHSITKAGAISYQVSYRNEEENRLVRDEFPLTKVHRSRGNGKTYEWDGLLDDVEVQ